MKSPVSIDELVIKVDRRSHGKMANFRCYRNSTWPIVFFVGYAAHNSGSGGKNSNFLILNIFWTMWPKENSNNNTNKTLGNMIWLLIWKKTHAKQTTLHHTPKNGNNGRKKKNYWKYQENNDGKVPWQLLLPNLNKAIALWWTDEWDDAE